MAVNLLAICRNNSDYELKRVRISAAVQQIIEGIFTQQLQDFYEGIDEQIQFDGGYIPEKNELLYVPIPDEAVKILGDAKSTLVSLDDLDSANFANENICALCILARAGGEEKLLIQNFSARQHLERKFCLVLKGDTFTQLSEPAFTLGNSLAGVIEAGRLKFRSFNNIRMVFDLKHFYLEATDVQLDAFAAHAALSVDDAAGFKSVADQRIRKLVYAISARDILGVYAVDHIVDTAAAEGIEISKRDGKIVLPASKAEIKDLLHFLDDAFYRAALSGESYYANSKRLARRT